MTGDHNLSEFEQKLLDNVDQHGCQVNFVFDAEGDDPDFAYSVGFRKTAKQPEVIVFGLERKLMLSMINETLRQCCEEGLCLAEGTEISDLVEGFDCVARRVHPSQIDEGYFNSSMWFHVREFGSELSEAYQLVWPGAVNGLYPWDIDCSEDIIEAQPPLYEARKTA
ncbi:hypothetical protein GCM10009096_12230 [Parasphingorhabdus litoris]|uniref:DUF4262 domain-containing protein n=1 Tax=Parasphingorhabdus litoris TaxID=394733 RepID=A0ABN1ABT5_9SPHN|nr:DUF4262 domain-containing protein [Parasphingorhabdus litoris]